MCHSEPGWPIGSSEELRILWSDEVSATATRAPPHASRSQAVKAMAVEREISVIFRVNAESSGMSKRFLKL